MVISVFASELHGQSTTISYQGSLNSGSTPANGSYDFEFRLFDAPANGTQLGVSVQVAGVTVTNGTFSTTFGFAGQFPGAARFLEIRVRPAGGGAFTLLEPRQWITSIPYAIKSTTADTAAMAASAATADTATNALQLGGVAANQFVLTGDPRLSDARNPLPGSANYIRNQILPQAVSNFNISGTGTANIMNAITHFSLNGDRVLSVAEPEENLAVGVLAGFGLTTGIQNTFVGRGAGFSNSTGSGNSFFGRNSGTSNNGFHNSFFGAVAGGGNTTGGFNSYFGRSAGQRGTSAGNNAFFGYNSGFANETGAFNTAIGSTSDFGAGNLANATAIGARAFVTANNSLVLGSINGVNGATANVNVGIGTTAPSERLHIATNGGNARIGGLDCGAGFVAITFSTSTCLSYSLLGDGNDTMLNAPTSGEIFFRIGNITRASISSGGIFSVNVLGASGSTALCRNASNQISGCSSSIRYKSEVNKFASGLDLIRKLNPVSFNWRDSGLPDLGLVAEDVAAAEPLLTTTNTNGEIEGVKYDRVGVVLINAVKEQQAEIEAQQKEIDELRGQVEALKRMICETNASAAICATEIRKEK